MNKFNNDIKSLINLPFKENRDKEDKVEKRRNRKTNAVDSAVDLCNKLYLRYSEEYKKFDGDSKENYDYNKLKTFSENKPNVQNIDLR